MAVALLSIVAVCALVIYLDRRWRKPENWWEL